MNGKAVTKIIIQNDAEIPDLKALQLVSEVVNLGMISHHSKYGKQYCFIITFEGYLISSHRNRKSHRFIIRPDHHTKKENE